MVWSVALRISSGFGTNSTVQPQLCSSATVRSNVFNRPLFETGRSRYQTASRNAEPAQETSQRFRSPARFREPSARFRERWPNPESSRRVPRRMTPPPNAASTEVSTLYPSSRKGLAGKPVGLDPRSLTAVAGFVRTGTSADRHSLTPIEEIAVPDDFQGRNRRITAPQQPGQVIDRRLQPGPHFGRKQLCVIRMRSAMCSLVGHGNHAKAKNANGPLMDRRSIFGYDECSWAFAV